MLNGHSRHACILKRHIKTNTYICTCATDIHSTDCTHSKLRIPQPTKPNDHFHPNHRPANPPDHFPSNNHYSTPKMPKQIDTTRFIILPLNPTLHHLWATAIFAHSNLFCGPVLPVLHPTITSSFFHAGFALAKRHVAHSIGSGFSFGVFDTQYPYRTDSARSQGGAFLWDEEEPINDGDELLRRMDFPLVSICLSYDGIYAFPGDIYTRGAEGVPSVMADMYEYAAGLDLRPLEETMPSRAGQIMFRNSTSTRKDYEGRGLMRYLSVFVMRDAQRRGFERIQFEIMNSGVKHVWMNPPEGEGFRSELVWEFVIGELEQRDEEGKVVKPYAKVRQSFSRVMVDLKADA